MSHHRSKRVLITGATGFIGRHCVPVLVERGYEVHAVSSRQVSPASDRVRWHRADLRDPRDMVAVVAASRPTVLLHLAWHVPPSSFWTSEENLGWVQASIELARAFAGYGGERMVMAGTCAEYDWRFGTCSETTTPLEPATLYGACKNALAQLLGAFTREARIALAWGRLFHVYGPHEYPARFVPSVIRSLAAREPFVCRHPEALRDLLHVEDVANAFGDLIESRMCGALNVASGSAVPLSDVVATIACHLGTDVPRDVLAPNGRAAGETYDLVADNRRLVEEVGWRPRYDLERGLGDTVRWWRDHDRVRLPT